MKQASTKTKNRKKSVKHVEKENGAMPEERKQSPRAKSAVQESTHPPKVLPLSQIAPAVHLGKLRTKQQTRNLLIALNAKVIMSQKCQDQQSAMQ